MSEATNKLTGEICGVQFGVQVYRQLSVAVTEKHVKSISPSFNRHDDKSVNADLDVVFALPALVIPQETRCVSRFAYGPAFVARGKRVDFLFPLMNRAPRCFAW